MINSKIQSCFILCSSVYLREILSRNGAIIFNPNQLYLLIILIVMCFGIYDVIQLIPNY